MIAFRKICLGLALLGVLGVLIGLGLGAAQAWAPAAVIAAVGLAIGLGAVPSLKGYQYTAWILAAVVGVMIYPVVFLNVGGFDLRNKWVVLAVVQLVMFGMGTQMSLRDFAGVLKMP